MGQSVNATFLFYPQSRQADSQAIKRSQKRREWGSKLTTGFILRNREFYSS